MMNTTGSPFSDRLGYHAPEVDITVREDAPTAVRDGILMLGYGANIGPSVMRDLLCQVLLTRPDQNNWSAGNIEDEVSALIDEASWFKVYDFAERLYIEIGRHGTSGNGQSRFESQLNQLFREKGVGWEMKNGMLLARGSEAFTLATERATDIMRESGTPTAANEIHEALRDISRRPLADVTGAIQHAMAALECVARKIDGSSDNLGQIINRLSIPAPLDVALHKLWGFSSQRGRHMQEGKEPNFEDAELVVSIASAVSVYLLQRRNG
jgi:AbiJ N-terminal domain 4